jgi:hypothetical protein
LTTVGRRFTGALLNHLRSWSSLWDLGISLACVLLLRRALPGIVSPENAVAGDPRAAEVVALWLCGLNLLLASVVSYRRANALRTEAAWTSVADEKNPCALLWGELLCSWVVALVLTLPAIAYLALAAPALLAPSTSALLALLASMVLITVMASAVFYFLSAYVLGAEGFSVLAITLVILGFSRSDVPREAARTLSKVPALAELPIPDIVSKVTRVITPPIEETIKAAIDGTFAGRGLFVAQALVQVVFLIALSMYVVSRWGALDLEARREAARNKGSEGSSASG